MELSDADFIPQIQKSPNNVSSSNIGTRTENASESEMADDTCVTAKIVDSEISLCKITPINEVSLDSLGQVANSYDSGEEPYISKEFELIKYLFDFTELPPGELLAFCDLEYKPKKLNNLRGLLIRRGLLTNDLMIWMCDHPRNELSCIIVRLLEAENFEIARILCSQFMRLMNNAEAVKNINQLSEFIQEETVARIIKNNIKNPFNILIESLNDLIGQKIEPCCPELEKESKLSMESVPEGFIALSKEYTRWLLCSLYGSPEYDVAEQFVYNQICFALLKLIGGKFVHLFIEEPQDVLNVMRLIESDALASAGFIIQKISALQALEKQ